MVGLALVLTGNRWAIPLTAASASAVLTGLGPFALNVLMHARPATGVVADRT